LAKVGFLNNTVKAYICGGKFAQFWSLGIGLL